jgi:hypothetical protein
MMPGRTCDEGQPGQRVTHQLNPADVSSTLLTPMRGKR